MFATYTLDPPALMGFNASGILTFGTVSQQASFGLWLPSAVTQASQVGVHGVVTTHCIQTVGRSKNMKGKGFQNKPPLAFFLSFSSRALFFCVVSSIIL